MLLLVAFAASLIPSVALYLWLRGIKGDDQGYRAACRRAVVLGFLCVFPIMGFDLVAAITQNLLGMTGLVRAVWHTFLMFAFCEELFKFLGLKKLLREHPNGRSWLDVTVLMSIIGLGFSLIEDIPYGLSTNAGQMIVRGITMGHVSYGFVMGHFYGKSLKTGRRAWAVVGFALPFLMHGLYDFCLSEEVAAINSDLGMISLLLAVIDLVLIIVLIVHVRKARRNPTYTDPLPGFERVVETVEPSETAPTPDAR